MIASSKTKAVWLYERFRELDPTDVVTSLTLILVVVSPGPRGEWYLIIPSTILGVLGLVCPPVRRSRNFWFVLAAVLILVHDFRNYFFSDNHKFLISWWVLAVGICLSQRDPGETLAFTGRVLVGLVFLVATIWKATAWNYLNGTSFEFLLMSDFRFFPLANVLGGLTAEQYQANQAALEGVARMESPISLHSSDRLLGLAYFLTWWTIIIEGILAVLFLVPRKRVEIWRHLVLLAFVVTTYPPTNVIQFGWILIIMALASCHDRFPRIRFGYFVAFLFVFCFSTGLLREAFYRWVS